MLEMLESLPDDMSVTISVWNDQKFHGFYSERGETKCKATIAVGGTTFITEGSLDEVITRSKEYIRENS